MSNEITVQAYTVPIGQMSSCSMYQCVAVTLCPGDTTVTVFERAEQKFRAKGYAVLKEAPFGRGMWMDSLHQIDSTLAGSSRIFDRLRAQSTDWSKLPDWQAWSEMMADQPI